MHTLRFATTPKMSTYLVAMFVGDFACREGSADGTAIRICSTPDKQALTAFALEAAQQQSDDAYSDGTGEIAIRQMRQNGAPYSFWESQVGIWTYPNGHSYLGDYHDDSKLVAALKDPVFRDYIAALEKKKGKAEAKLAAIAELQAVAKYFEQAEAA